MKYDVIIVGGGAAGLMAAAKLCQEDKKVLILEGASRVGKKLLSTGAGRCNLSNRFISPKFYRGDTSFLSEFFIKYSCDRIQKEFSALGLLTREDAEGRIYPYSLQASSVLDILRKSTEKADIICECEVTKIEKKEDGFVVLQANAQEYHCEKVIISCGGAASSHLACKSGGYILAENLGHSIGTLSPSLVPVSVFESEVKALKGLRCRAKVKLCLNEKIIACESGEVQFAQGALSGICIFNISRFAKKGMKIVLDLMPEYSEDEIIAIIKDRDDTVQELFSGILNKRIAAQALKAEGFAPIDKVSPKSAAFAVKNFEFSVIGTLKMNQAQVTAGGVPICEVNTKTMESNIQKGLYFCGEILNVDGICGGYNLHFAWSSALAAAEDIKGESL